MSTVRGTPDVRVTVTDHMNVGVVDTLVIHAETKRPNVLTAFSTAEDIGWYYTFVLFLSLVKKANENMGLSVRLVILS
jgi:hypothetical protein